MRNISFIKLLLLVPVIVLSCGLAAAQTIVFSYQGKLPNSVTPATGSFEMEFKLFDAAAGGNQIGATVSLSDVEVKTRSFSVQLDFGAAAFSGADRFIEISVRRQGSESFAVISPREQMLSVPFAIRALSAASADSFSGNCVLCITDEQIQSVDGGKVIGTVTNAAFAANAQTAVNATNAQNAVNAQNSQKLGGVNASQYLLKNGDGSQLTNLPGGFKWQMVSGVSQQAQPNNGYLANNDAQVTITLPASPNVGDVVRVSSPGAGGWKIAQNAGQSIIVTQIKFFNERWIPHETNRRWEAIASSADGSKLTAVVYGGRIYTSTDSGISWTARETDRLWKSVAISADGSKQVAVVEDGQIYTSTDSGATWTPRETSRNWYAVASSADGSKLVAVVLGGQIYTSTDSGKNWIPRETNQYWVSVASSNDGNKLIAAPASETVRTSTDAGENWIRGDLFQPLLVASSADGNKLVVIATAGNFINTSSDAGATWTQRIVPANLISSVASSADGSKLVLAGGSGIYVSHDSGATWTQRERPGNWRSVASSADGSKLAAVFANGQIYTSAPTTTIGATGFLTGGQFTSIELQYIGNGQFLPISFVGEISGR